MFFIIHNQTIKTNNCYNLFFKHYINKIFSKKYVINKNNCVFLQS